KIMPFVLRQDRVNTFVGHSVIDGLSKFDVCGDNGLERVNNRKPARELVAWRETYMSDPAIERDGYRLAIVRCIRAESHTEIVQPDDDPLQFVGEAGAPIEDEDVFALVQNSREVPLVETLIFYPAFVFA